MNRKLDMLESLLTAYDVMMGQVSEGELVESGLFTVWMHQVGSALMLTGMEVERQVWDSVRKIKVSLRERKALEAYGAGMRAILVGMLHSLEDESAHES